VVIVVKVVIRFETWGLHGVIRVFWHGLVTAMGDVPKMVPTHTHTVRTPLLTAGSCRTLQRGLRYTHYIRNKRLAEQITPVISKYKVIHTHFSLVALFFDKQVKLPYSDVYMLEALDITFTLLLGLWPVLLILLLVSLLLVLWNNEVPPGKDGDS